MEQAGLQTLCSNAAFSCAEIHTVSPGFLVHGKTDDGEAFAIRDLEEVCREAFATEQLWGEMLLPWSQPSGSRRGLPGAMRTTSLPLCELTGTAFAFT